MSKQKKYEYCFLGPLEPTKGVRWYIMKHKNKKRLEKTSSLKVAKKLCGEF